MTEQKEVRPKPPATLMRPGERTNSLSGIELTAAALSVVWLIISTLFLAFSDSEGDGGLRFLLVILVVFFPVGMIWVAAVAVRASRIIREESGRLQTAIDAIRHAYITQNQAGGRDHHPHPSIVKKLEEIADAQKKAETTLAMFTSTRAAQIAVQAAAPDPDIGDQPTLALGTPAEALQPPLSTSDFIRALHFPETADDQEGFAALRRALKDRPSAQLVQAAQDVLTLLSQDGIYMDDLRPDMARPELWRRFAKGERGRTIAALGGVRDRSSLALAAGRMKQDPIFRDAAHHFLRLFDKGFARFEETATDAEISELAGTRTARAFMLLGRVTGTFD
ncbi:hypothetical protein [Marivita hallyeonensis]|uniref:Uncharacterized protein n=1 Tax=Marivita hallyeonensis TaxID=996342 RepID=A0A1M5UTJ8_9RHOB|nr:hypothetical protein [Marivita hallyeonensis]SHH66301.1 hypothetical protein SAMN05443551_2794 [Marivita hallyeonensis]